MFISHKSNILQQFHETEWECRRKTKGMSKPEYWVWLETIKDSDGNPDYSDETEYTIVKCTDEDVSTRLIQLDRYINNNRRVGEAKVYNIKYYASKRDAEEILDLEGKSHSPKQYVQSHFVGDDSAKDARLLADKWINVRRDRDRKLAETDYLALSDNTLATNMKTYRSKLRSVPQDNSDPDDITWPTKPLSLIHI